MSATSPNRPINPELLAAKLAAARNFEQMEVAEQVAAHPRFVEVLLFLQWVSQPDNYTGGLRRFASDLIAASPDMLGTSAMIDHGVSEKITEERMISIFRSLPRCARESLIHRDLGFDWLEMMPSESTVAALLWNREALRGLQMEDAYSADDAGDNFIATLSNEERARKEAARRDWKSWAEKAMSREEGVTFFNLCCDAATNELTRDLRDLCEMPHTRLFGAAPWYFSKLGEAILRFIDSGAKSLAESIAETEITRTVFKWLATARGTNRAVMISGNSRFGKTESLRVWCQMNPGTARLVNTPASSSESDLLREVGRALGLDTGPRSRANQLRERIDYVLRNTRLMLVMDEFQFCLPQSFTRNTAPARLNWVRRSVMDAGLPCAFCCTPQSYNPARNRFVKLTGYAMEQFEERLLRRVELPDELRTEDLLSVARIHFPKLDADYLEYVVSMVSAPERNYMSDLEKIATLSRLTASQNGRDLQTLEDIDEAIKDVLPPSLRATIKAAEPAESVALQSPRTPRAKRVQTTCNRTARSVSPLGLAPDAETAPRINFDSENPTALVPAGGG